MLCKNIYQADKCKKIPTNTQIHSWFKLCRNKKLQCVNHAVKICNEICNLHKNMSHPAKKLKILICVFLPRKQRLVLIEYAHASTVGRPGQDHPGALPSVPGPPAPPSPPPHSSPLRRFRRCSLVPSDPAEQSNTREPQSNGRAKCRLGVWMHF